MSRRHVALASVATLAGLAGLLWAVRASADEGPADTRLTAYSGEVDVKLKGDTDWTPADNDTPLENGDEVKTGADSKAEISFGGQSIYELQENSALVVAELSPVKTAFDLSVGTLLLHVKKLLTGQSVEVRTKAAMTSIVGTEVGVQAGEDGITGVGVYDGEVIVEGKGVPGVPGKQVKVGKDKEFHLKFGVNSGEAKPMKGFLPFKPRLKAMSGRRIELRRDWKPLSAEERADKRKQLADSRLKRRQQRAEKLQKEGRTSEPGVKPAKKAAKGGKKGGRKGGKKKK